MANETDNHGYKQPQEGEQNWGRPLNETIAALETDVEIRDSDGDRGQYSPTAGARFTATDTGRVYLGDGQAWQPTLAVWRVLAASDDGVDTLLAGAPSNTTVGKPSGAVVAGGEANQVGESGGPVPDHATVSGGEGNTAGSLHAVVSGGLDNTSSGLRTTIGGGQGNAAAGEETTIAGGRDNVTSGRWSTVGGGSNNEASTNSTTVAGGDANEASSDYAAVGGGVGNTASGAFATIGGGDKNRATATHATIAGGGPSDADDPLNTTNVVHDHHGTVGGGGGNTAGVAGSGSGEFATVAGGKDNTAGHRWTTVSGGVENQATGRGGTVGGGSGNTVTGPHTTGGGGYQNTVSGSYATVAGGYENEATGATSAIGGGANNATEGQYATVPGGQNNTAVGEGSLAAGTDATAGHAGSFVWADSSSQSVSSTGPDQFVVDAGGGVGIGTTDPAEQLDVAGAVAVRDVGASVYLDALVGIEPSVTETVVFDAVVADDRDEYDTTTGVFTCASDGDYHVATTLEWNGRLAGGTDHVVEIAVDGTLVARRYNEIAGSSNESAYATEHISKTLRDLSAGAEIEIRVYHTSGDTEFLFSGRSNSYLTIDRVG